MYHLLLYYSMTVCVRPILSGCRLKGMGRAFRFLAAVLAGALLAPAADTGVLDLRGKILDENRRVRTFRVSLFSVETAFSTWTLTDPGGEFRFRKLNPGNYTLSIARRGLGEIHRTIVVTASLADKKGVVRIRLPFSPSEAAES